MGNSKRKRNNKKKQEKKIENMKTSKEYEIKGIKKGKEKRKRDLGHGICTEETKARAVALCVTRYVPCFAFVS